MCILFYGFAKMALNLVAKDISHTLLSICARKYFLCVGFLRRVRLNNDKNLTSTYSNKLIFELYFMVQLKMKNFRQLNDASFLVTGPL